MFYFISKYTDPVTAEKPAHPQVSPLLVCEFNCPVLVDAILSYKARSENTAMEATQAESSAGTTSLRCALKTHMHAHASVDMF